MTARQLARHATGNTLDVRGPKVPARASLGGYRPTPVDITATVATLPEPTAAPDARKGMHPALMILAICVIVTCIAASFLAIGIMIGRNR